MTYTGKILVLAFPDTFVKMSDELMCKILPLVGLGTKTHIKAGHAALVLIENATGNAQYFDFGRYITPLGMGRVRSQWTDVELRLPIQADMSQSSLQNVEVFLQWLDAHPEITHGSGRLIASICDAINYEKAYKYICDLQSQGSIPYRAFGKLGSNCARFVTDTILASTSDTKIINHLRRNKRFTPSTVGNVEKAATSPIYKVSKGIVELYTSTALRENLKNYFDKRLPQKGTQTNAVPRGLPEGAQLLHGTGSSAWFHLNQISSDKVAVQRYTEEGKQDFCGVAILPASFNIFEAYRFVYDSHCQFCTLSQNGALFRLPLQELSSTSLAQKVHSA